MSKTTTCFDVIFQRKQSNRLFFLYGIDTMLPCRLESNLQERQDHVICSFQKKSHGCCYGLWASLFAHFKHTSPARFHSFTEPQSPSATSYVRAMRCRRLRYGFLLAHALANCHSTQNSCTVQFCAIAL